MTRPPRKLRQARYPEGQNKLNGGSSRLARLPSFPVALGAVACVVEVTVEVTVGSGQCERSLRTEKKLWLAQDVSVKLRILFVSR